jgi:NIMA (never in mitosis gene a)-related kinase 1/4/5
MDYASAGDLRSELENRAKGKEDENGNRDGIKKYLTEDELLTWFTQLCLALKYLHNKQIIHRDLKSQNIFLTKQGLIKLGDFGIARVLSCTQSRAHTYVGTAYYLSPEIVNSKPYGCEADIWSLGVLLYEMAALELPFQGSSILSISRRICKSVYKPIPSCYSASVSLMIRSLLQVDQNKRPKIDDIINWPAVQRRLGVLF